MAVVDVPWMGERRDDDSVGLGHGDGGLGPELVFLVLPAFGDAADLGFVQ